MADKRTRVMLANLLKNGELYAAHQKYRTTAARLLKTPAPSSFGTGGSRGSASSDAPALPYDDDAVKAAELLYEGARALLEKGELGGGTDLTLYLLEVWRTRGVPCTDDTRNKVQTLIALVGGTGNWRKSIIDHAVHWTAVVGDETPAGDESLHAYIGQILYKDRDYLGGEHHFIASLTRDSARSLASLLFDWYKSEPSSASPSSSTSSLGRYCARGVLSYLESSSILCARVFLSSFLALATSHDPSLLIERTSLSTWQDPSESDPELVVTRLASLNFLQLALRTCQIGAAEQQVRRPPGQGQGMQTVTPGRTAWTQLLSRYEREVPWLREGEVKESLSYLGQMYFNIKPAQQGGANILGDLMSSLFGGGGGGGGASQAALPGPAGRGRGRGGASSTPKITQAGLD